MLERITNAFFTPSILLEANESASDVERFVLIVKWYLSGWHIAPKAVKKPLNPILGETFSCYWDDLDGHLSAYYLAEQTSHHPPESSYFYIIPSKRIRGDGVLIPRSKFLGNSSAAMMEGVAKLTLGEHDGEVYTVTQPNIYCRGILFGKLRYELGDHMFVKCEKLGMEADIEFKTKGFISGDYDAIEGTIKQNGKVLFTVTGKWNGKMEIYDVSSGVRSEFYDTAAAKMAIPKVKPLDQQAENESRKLWFSTLSALEDNDHTRATNEKFEVEDKQRRVAKERSEKGQEFEPAFFLKSAAKDVPYVIKADIDINNDAPEEMTKKLMGMHNILPV